MSAWCVFGYGSLMYEPACPEHLVGMVDGTLPGWRRAFNKRSLARGCGDAEALLPEGLPGWTTEARRVSLCLGLAPDAGSVAGKVLRYRPEAAADVQAVLDAREGVHDDRDPDLNGYDRQWLDVVTAAGTVRALVYVTRPGGTLHVPDLSVAATAKVLAHATPRERGSRALGAQYLEDALDVLAEVGVDDAGMTALMQAVTAYLP